MWPEEATTIVAACRSLQELTGIGHHLPSGCTVGSCRPRPSNCPFIRSRVMSRNSAEIEEDETKAVEIWSRRIKCIVACGKRPGFSSWGTRCLTDWRACGCGHQDCESA